MVLLCGLHFLLSRHPHPLVLHGVSVEELIQFLHFQNHVHRLVVLFREELASVLLELPMGLYALRSLQFQALQLRLLNFDEVGWLLHRLFQEHVLHSVDSEVQFLQIQSSVIFEQVLQVGLDEGDWGKELHCLHALHPFGRSGVFGLLKHRILERLQDAFSRPFPAWSL